MAVPFNLDQDAPDERPAETGWAYERIVIGGGTLLAVLLLWGAFGRSGLIDPLFISSPTRVAQAGFSLLQDNESWNDLRVSGTEFLFGYGLAVAIAIPLGLAIGL